MKLEQYDSVYFLGIGGIGMSAIARWFKHKGLKVAGYDRTPTPLTHELLEEGMEIHFEDKIEFIPGYISKQKTLVVFTPAIPKNHVEHAYLKSEGFTILKRSEILGLLTKNYKTVAIVTMQNEAMLGLRDLFKKDYKGEILLNEEFAPTDLDKTS